jgi:hypothetical protein
MTTIEAVRLIYFVLIGVPVVAIAFAALWALSSVRAEAIKPRDYHTNHPQRKGY